MAIRKIFGYKDPILRKKTKEVTEFDESLSSLLDDMLDTLHKARGVGLAAPQVGVLRAVCIIEIKDKLYEFVNPEIISHSESTNVYDEGCLSILDTKGKSYYFPVERYNRVTIEAKNRFGEKIKVKLTGFAARAAQHEIDHLSGILFIDKVANLPNDVL